MGKSKRNKRRRDSWLDDPIARANAEVAAAERTLLAKRQAAARAAATAINGQQQQQSPAEQAEAFFNRPGDYFVARFNIGGHVDGGPSGVTFVAECVFKADEQQLPYLVEVMRQIRGGFGDRARIELSRARTQAGPSPAEAMRPDVAPPAFDPRPTATNRAMARVQAEHAAAVQAAEICKAHREENCERCDPNVDDLWTHPRDVDPSPWTPPAWDPTAPVEAPWADNVERLLEHDGSELTREQLQAQLPGMTRAEVAEELGVHPADIGGEIPNTGDLELEQIAAEMGLSPLDLEPIEMRGGGRVYAVKPRQTQPPAGRHAAPEAPGGDNKAGGAK